MTTAAAARNQLTPTMYEAIAYARVHGSKLIRFPGGFWVGFGCQPYTSKAFSTPTVNALVSRNRAQFTQWHEGRSGKFPIEMTLADALIVPDAAAVPELATTPVEHEEAHGK